MSLDIILTIIIIILFFFEKTIKSRKFLFYFLIKLHVIINDINSKLMSLIIIIIFSGINYVIFFSNFKFFFFFFYIYFYYIYKFLLYYITIIIKIPIHLIIIVIFLFKFNFFYLILLIFFILDFIICINNSNKQYDLAFIGFTEDNYKIMLTNKGLTKIIYYFDLLIYDNIYFFEDLKDNYFYNKDFDYYYKNYNDTYK